MVRPSLDIVYHGTSAQGQKRLSTASLNGLFAYIAPAGGDAIEIFARADLKAEETHAAWSLIDT